MEFLKIGFINKTHGLKGEVKVLPLTDSMDRYFSLKEVYIFKDNHYIKEKIDFVRKQNKNLIIKFENYNSNEHAEELKSVYLYVKRENGVELEEDEYYSQDLIGCDVVFNNEIVGKVFNLHNAGSCDILVIKGSGQEVFFPLLKQYIDEIDIIEKKILINQYEGFFD